MATKPKSKMTLPRVREIPAIRHAQVIEAALRLAAKVGAQGLVRDRIAEEAGLSSSILHRYFGGMDHLRDLIIQEAFARGLSDVLYKSLSVQDFKRLNKDPALTEALCAYLKS